MIHQEIRLYALPVVVAASMLEGLVLARRRPARYDWKAAMVSLLDVALRKATQWLPLMLMVPLLQWLWVHRVATVQMDTVWSFLLLFLGQELAYYGYHRASHRVRWFWLTHSVHHSSNDMNLAAAYRLGVTGKLTGTLLFFLPLVWIGFRPDAVLSALAINLLYQFWIHVTWIPRLGWLEYVFNTPSAHRVHHASNLDYLDANYGGVLIIFDRLFGTYRAERRDEPCRYGLVHPVTTHNPLVIEFGPWRDLWRDLRHARNVAELAGYLFRPPGWRPDGNGQTTEDMRRQATTVALVDEGRSRRRPLSLLGVVCVLACLVFVACSSTASAEAAMSASIGGRTRHWNVYVPSSYHAGDPMPLVVAFHGHGGTPITLSRQSGLDAVADRLGFIVVYPMGIDRSWAAGVNSPADQAQVDDVAFVSTLLDRLEQTYSIDRAHVVFTGFSNGAHFVQLLGCRLAGRVSAIVPVSGTLSRLEQPDCHPARPLTVVAFHGTADPIDPYAGGRIAVPDGGAVLSVDSTMTDWAKWNGCSLVPQTVREKSDGAIKLERVDWPACRNHVRVTLFRIVGGGHTWPDGPQYLPASMIGKATHIVSTSDVIGEVAIGKWN